MGQTEEHDILNKTTQIKKAKNEHIPSTVQADTLFTFTSHVDYLITTLKNAMVSPRYCVEDLSYLKIQGIKKMAFPMKCACINGFKIFIGVGFPESPKKFNEIGLPRATGQLFILFPIRRRRKLPFSSR